MMHLLSHLALSLNGSSLPHANPDNVIQPVLQFFFAAAGAIALLLITIASLQYTLSRGDGEKTKRAKETIIYAVVGMVIAISGYAVVTFIFSRITV